MKTRELVFAGGGVRGLAYVGALQALRDELGADFGARHPSPTRACGVSVGAFVAMLIVCGYNVSEMTQTAARMDMDVMVRANPLLLFGGGVAVDDGAGIRALLEGALRRKGFAPDTTLAQLREATGVSLETVVTDLTDACVAYVDATTHPHLPVVTAVQASMSLPVVFPPVVVDGHLWVDGGILENFPIARYAADACLGFTFKWRMEQPPRSFISYVARVLHVMTIPGDIAAWRLTSAAHRARTIVLDTGTVSTLGTPDNASMDLPAPVREALLRAGKANTLEALKRWDEGHSLDMEGADDNVPDPGRGLAPNRILPSFLSWLRTCAPEAHPAPTFRVGLKTEAGNAEHGT